MVSTEESNPKLSLPENDSPSRQQHTKAIATEDDVKTSVFFKEAVVVRQKDTSQKNDEKIVCPPSHFPQPEAPPGLYRKTNKSHGQRKVSRSLSHESSTTAFNDVSLLGKYIKERGSAVMRRISSMKDRGPSSTVTEIHIPDMKVIVQTKNPEEKTTEKVDISFEGQISFFSRSNCRDCGALRSFFRQKGLKYVEINLDVFPNRAKELKERSGSSSVPQIFLNEKLLGGLVVVNSLRNSGELERRLKEMAGEKCPESGPKVPVYGYDDENPQAKDSMVPIVRVLRQRLVIQDRFIKMKRVKNCFSGGDLVEAVISHLNCDRSKAVETGKELANKHFIHHIFRVNVFEDGSEHYYRLLEHDPLIPKCFNFRGSTNDNQPKPAVIVGQQLTKLMIAIVEAYASDDRRDLDYYHIGISEEFRRYRNMVQDLQRVDIFAMSTDEKLAFFLNLYNAMVIHAIFKAGRPEGFIARRNFSNEFCYIIGGYPFSLSTIKNGILRSNRKHTPYSFAKPIGHGDKRLELTHPKLNPLIHFGLYNGNRSTPPVRFFSAQGIEVELRQAAREFFQAAGIHIDLEKRTVYLTRIIKWYSVDFGQDKEILNWILNFLDATKAGLLTHLLSDGSPINIVYQD